MATWKDIEQELKRVAPPVAPRPPEAFWEDFTARASLRPRTVECAPARPVFGVRWALAAAAGLLLLAGSSILFLNPASHVPLTNDILALTVAAPHRAVLIMNDQAGGTILWVDCEENGTGKGGA
jgi:hypothetical protein